MAKKESKEVAKKETTALATLPEMPESWGDEGLDGRDILIGKALLMQGQSTFVADGKANVGEIRNNLTEELLGGKGKPFKFIPFFTNKVWVISKKLKTADDKVRWEYVETYPCTPKNEDQEWEAEEGEYKIRRDKVMQFYSLNPEKLDDLPVVIAFRRTSYRAGRKLASAAMQLKSIKKVIASRVFELNSATQEKDGSKYWILDAKMTDTETNAAQMTKAFEWYKTVQAGLVKVSEENDDLGAEPVETSEPVAKSGDEQKDNVKF